MIHSVSQLESETSKREFMQACPDIASLWGFLSCFSGDQSRSGVQAAASPDPYGNKSACRDFGGVAI